MSNDINHDRRFIAALAIIAGTDLPMTASTRAFREPTGQFVQR